MNYITIPEPKFSRYADNHMTCLTNCPKFVMMQPQKRYWKNEKEKKANIYIYE